MAILKSYLLIHSTNYSLETMPKNCVKHIGPMENVLFAFLVSKEFSLLTRNSIMYEMDKEFMSVEVKIQNYVGEDFDSERNFGEYIL